MSLSRWRQLVYFSGRLVKDTLLLVLLGLDLIFMLVTYIASLAVPGWVFAIVPIIAIFLASFNIYRQGTADTRLEITEIPDSYSDWGCHASEDGREFRFKAAIHGHMMNFGPQVGIVEKLGAVVGFNGLFDPYVLRRMEYSAYLSRFYKRASEGLEGADQAIELPFVLQPGQVQPCSAFLHVSITTEERDEILIELRWLEQIDVKLNYEVRDGSGVEAKQVKFGIAAGEMGLAAADAALDHWAEH